MKFFQWISKAPSREQKINWVVDIVLIGFIFSLFFNSYRSSILSDNYPLNTFLFRPWDRFYDFIHLYNLSRHYNPYFEPYLFTNLRNIFPFLFFVGYVISLKDLTFSLPFVLISFLLLFSFITYHSILGKNNQSSLINTAILLISYPILFALDRANLEILVFITLFLFTAFYLRKKYILSSILLGISLSLKPFPGIFLILFFTEKKYKEIIFTIITSLILTLIPLATFQNGLLKNLHQLIYSLTTYSKIYAIQNEGLAFGHSLWGLLKFIMIIFLGYPSDAHLSFLLNIYSILTLIALVILFIYIKYIEQTFWKKIALLIISLLLFPTVSADYRLLHIFIPLFLFINEKIPSKSDWIYIFLFGLLLIPKNYFLIPDTEISISSAINPIILLTMMMMIGLEGIFKKKLISVKISRE